MKRYIKCSSVSKVVGDTWPEFISNVENQTKFKVDSADKRRYSEFITLLDGLEVWEGEVTKYHDGRYEMLMSNVDYCYGYNSDSM